MSEKSERTAPVRIVEAIRAALPEEASDVDAVLQRDGYEEDAHHTWIERFSQLTTDAIKGRDFFKATEHLQLVARLLDRGDEETIRCIDVAYVESLMWDINDEDLQRTGWRIVPVKLRDLYVAMWGERPFMK